MDGTETKPNALVRGKAFVQETWAELQKTTWPTRKEVEGTTVVVIICVLITAVYLYAADYVIVRALDGVQRLIAR